MLATDVFLHVWAPLVLRRFPRAPMIVIIMDGSQLAAHGTESALTLVQFNFPLDGGLISKVNVEGLNPFKLGYLVNLILVSNDRKDLCILHILIVATAGVASAASPPSWDCSEHIVSFVKSVAQDSSLAQANPKWGETISSLKGLANALEYSHPTPGLASTRPELDEHLYDIPAPPMDEISNVLWWAKAHATDFRIQWICNILPLAHFQQICTKVYFGVDDYSEAESIIASSFLSYVFAEYAVVYGDAKHGEYCQFFRSSLGQALSKLPLLLTASLEVVAALTLGALYMVEENRATQSWILISTAMTLCQTLRYHQLDTSQGSNSMQARLFWSVYTYERGLSLRLGRCSGIMDSQITLPIEPDEHRAIRHGRIQGKVYDQLYRPKAPSTATQTRIEAVNTLARELQLIIDETQVDISDALNQDSSMEGDPMKVIYLHCDLVCQSSILSMILRAVPGIQDANVHDRYVTVARNTLDLHDQCMRLVKGCRDPLLVRRYISWFAASFKSETADSDPTTHPYRVYELLSQTARLCVESGTRPSHTNRTSPTPSDLPMVDDVVASFAEVSGVGIPACDDEYNPGFNVGDWFQSNQQFMWLLHENIPY
ncbi:hypothetical protein HG530_012353 [Fusarium avenaceum]|nr:hypothetical protein HG530_012353 [Fusarium avenaceum]